MQLQQRNTGKVRVFDPITGSTYLATYQGYADRFDKEESFRNNQLKIGRTRNFIDDVMNGRVRYGYHPQQG